MSVIKPQKNFLVFTICSSSIVVNYGYFENGSHKILIEDSLFFRKIRVQSLDQYFREAVALLDILADRTCKAVSRMGGIIPDEITCVYTSPWVDTLLHTDEMEFAQDTVFNGMIRNNIEGNLIAVIETNTNPETIICNSKTITMKLNGYRTNTPEGKLFKKISVTFLLDNIDAVSKTAIEGVLIKHFPHRAYRHTSLAAVVQSYIQLHLPSYTGLVVFVGVEVKEYMQFKKGQLISTGTDSADIFQVNSLQNIQIFEENHPKNHLDRISLSTLSAGSSLR